MSDESMYPRSSNTGVQHTYVDGAIALVDWVSATFPHFKTWQQVAELLGLESSEFKVMEKGLNWYKGQVRRGAISILFDGNNPDMGVHLLMGGEACREYEQENKLDWPTLFMLIHGSKQTTEITRDGKTETVEIGEGGHLTRLDLAIDDIRKETRGYFTPEQVLKKLESGLCSSKFKDYDYQGRGSIKDGSSKGKTVYLGSKKSDIKIRIYDKKHERQNNTDKEVDVQHWVRTEVEMRDQRADLAAKHIYENYAKPDGLGVGVIIAGILRNYLTFHSRSTKDSNKSRWPRWAAWEKFLGDAAQLKLTVKAPDRTIDTRRAWIDRQTAKTLGMLFCAYDSDLNWLIETLQRGMELLEAKDINEIEAYQRNKKLVELALAKQRLSAADQTRFQSFDAYLMYRTELQNKINRLEGALGDEQGNDDWEIGDGFGDEVYD